MTPSETVHVKLAALRAVADAATSGWVARTGNDARVYRQDGSYMDIGDALYHPKHAADATFIATAPTAIPALLDAVEEATALLRRCGTYNEDERPMPHEINDALTRLAQILP